VLDYNVIAKVMSVRVPERVRECPHRFD
jgi:hypothetical protein